MQTLFALHTCDKANFHLGIEHIREEFRPDLNSMEEQDTAALNAEVEVAVKLFKDNYKADSVPDKSYSDKIKDAVAEAKANCKKGIEKDRAFLKKQMVIDVERIHDWYLLLLRLLVEFGESVSDTIEKNKAKLVDTTVFYSANYLHNRALTVISENDDFQRRCIKKDLSWDKNKSTIRQWFKTLISEDETFVKYQGIDKPTWADDIGIVSYIIKSIILKDESINAHISESDSNWDENRHIAKGLLKKTLKGMGTTKKLEMMDLSYNWEEDKAFFVDLFKNTLKGDKEFEDLISERTQNWDIERIAITDKVILKLAISEMVNCPSIPIKVTINEYLELAKVYSTPKSRQFINGLLDKLANELKASGRIKKSGRGLIDNK